METLNLAISVHDVNEFMGGGPRLWLLQVQILFLGHNEGPCRLLILTFYLK